MSLRRLALDLLQIRDPDAKVLQTLAVQPERLPCGADAALETPAHLPGRPERPMLVAPRDLPARAVGTHAGHSALLHALAHIEHNAVNLALDACWRFGGMPDAYYRDWFRIAREEAQHFGLLRDHLATLGVRYGDLAAHDGLWEMVARTCDDVLARMALVPRTLEARGLDASPAVRQRLASIGDAAGARIVDLLLRDEIGHVAVGNRWFHRLCAERGLEPVATYAALSLHYRAPVLPGPYNLPARQAAGFTDAELSYLQPKKPPASMADPTETRTDARSPSRPPRR